MTDLLLDLWSVVDPASDAAASAGLSLSLTDAVDFAMDLWLTDPSRDFTSESATPLVELFLDPGSFTDLADPSRDALEPARECPLDLGGFLLCSDVLLAPRSDPLTWVFLTASSDPGAVWELANDLDPATDPFLDPGSAPPIEACDPITDPVLDS